LAVPLADVFLGGVWKPEAMTRRAATLLGERPKGLSRLAREVVAAFPTPPRPSRLVSFLVDAWPVYQAWSNKVRVRAPSLRHPTMSARFEVPAIATEGDLASALELTIDELAWMADRKNRLRKQPDGPILHYVVRLVPKRSGNGFRALEAPKPRLKSIQRWILDRVLNLVPVHPAAFGFVQNRSVVDFAAGHTGKALVVRFDLEDFFASCRKARVHAIFEALGYPRNTAATLAALCTTRTPLAHLGRVGWESRLRLAVAHLPQGAPTSPALANLCAFGLDTRLSALAKRFGGHYSRYADDLAFSFSEPADVRRLPRLVAGIASTCGFTLNHRKTRVMRSGQRQQLAGIVVNERTSIRRTDLDLIRAILHRCAIHGPSAENRDHHADFQAHLRGRIAWVAQVHPARGAALLQMFQAIDWTR
jgi:hypothetical protein